MPPEIDHCVDCDKDYNPKLETNFTFRVPHVCGSCARTRLRIAQTTPAYKVWEEGQQARESQMEAIRREQLGESED